MKTEIIRQYNEAIIQPGEAVGMLTAEALGGPITQMVLNTFHQSGSSKNASAGIKRATELLTATENIKNPSCTVFFKDQTLSLDDVVLDVRPEFTEITMKDLTVGLPDIETKEQVETPWWYGPYSQLIRDDFLEGDINESIMILKLNVNVMYSYKITIEDVAKVLEMHEAVIAVYSPMSIGEIHIYPIMDKISAELEKKKLISTGQADMVFLWNIVYKNLENLVVKGIPGIRKIYPVETPIWQIVREEQQGPNNTWDLILNPVRMIVTGITTAKLVKLCDVTNVTVIDITDNVVRVSTPNNVSPTKHINDLIAADKQAEIAYEKDRIDKREKIIRRPPTEIKKASLLTYADTDNAQKVYTMRKLLAHPAVDSTRTYSNNVQEIVANLGIEAGRAFLIKEIWDMIKIDSYINPRHIVLLVDFMTSLGIVSGMNITGLSRQPVGALEKASYQKSMNVFREGAAIGEYKEVRGTSASIYVGKKAMIGTGFYDKYMDTSQMADIIDKLNTDDNFEVNATDVANALDNIEGAEFGVDMMVVEGDLEEMFDEPMFMGVDTGEQKSEVVNKSDVPQPPSIKGPLTVGPATKEAGMKVLQDIGLSCPIPAKDTLLLVDSLPSELVTEDIMGEIPIGDVPPSPSLMNVTSPSSEILSEIKKHSVGTLSVNKPVVGLPPLTLPPLSLPTPGVTEPIEDTEMAIIMDTEPAPVPAPAPEMILPGKAQEGLAGTIEKQEAAVFNLDDFLS